MCMIFKLHKIYIAAETISHKVNKTHLATSRSLFKILWEEFLIEIFYNLDISNVYITNIQKRE